MNRTGNKNRNWKNLLSVLEIFKLLTSCAFGFGFIQSGLPSIVKFFKLLHKPKNSIWRKSSIKFLFKWKKIINEFLPNAYENLKSKANYPSRSSIFRLSNIENALKSVISL